MINRMIGRRKHVSGVASANVITVGEIVEVSPHFHVTIGAALAPRGVRLPGTKIF
jgi:hypothetical protein